MSTRTRLWRSLVLAAICSVTLGMNLAVVAAEDSTAEITVTCPEGSTQTYHTNTVSISC